MLTGPLKGLGLGFERPLTKDDSLETVQGLLKYVALERIGLPGLTGVPEGWDVFGRPPASRIELDDDEGQTFSIEAWDGSKLKATVRKARVVALEGHDEIKTPSTRRPRWRERRRFPPATTPTPRRPGLRPLRAAGDAAVELRARRVRCTLGVDGVDDVAPSKFVVYAMHGPSSRRSRAAPSRARTSSARAAGAPRGGAWPPAWTPHPSPRRRHALRAAAAPPL